MLHLITLLFALCTLALGQQIDTVPVVVQCAPTRLTFSGGVAPYSIDIINSGDVGGLALTTIESATAGAVTWTCNVAAGTSITLRLRDGQGALAFSAPITVQRSRNTACLGAESSDA